MFNVIQVRKEYGAGSEVYVNVLNLVAKIKSKEMSAENASKRAEYLLRATTPPVKETKRAEYCELLKNIGNVNYKSMEELEEESKVVGLSKNAVSFLPPTSPKAVQRGEKLKPLF